MVAHLVRLKLVLLGNALKRSVWQILGLVFSLLYASTVGIALFAGLAYLSRRDIDMAATVVVFAGGLLVLAWWFLPLVAFGVDSTLDPQRFALFAIRRRDLLWGLGIAGLVGVPGLLTVLVTLGTLLVWRESPAAMLAALVCWVVAVATCVVGSRATTTALAPLRSSRRFREVTGVLVFLPLLVIAPLAAWASGEIDADRVTLHQVADVVSWLPFGAVWGVPAAVAAGDLGVAAAKLAIAVATLVVLVALWGWALDRMLTSPARRDGHGARPRGLGVFGFLPATPTWAVVARCLVYWVRDPRYVGSLAVVPLLPFLVHFIDPGTGIAMLALAPVTAFMLGWIISADVAYDHTAFWLHVVTGVSGRADRLGRVIAAGLVGVPVTAVFTVGAAWFTGRWDDLPAVVGASFGVLLTALGLSSVVSARFVYPVPKPGDGPFSTPQGSAVANLTIQTGGWLVLGLLVLPEIAVAAVATGNPALGWAACVTGLALGSAVLVVGVRLGGRVYDVRSAELMQQVIAIG
ncbi:ABC-2 type transport system permease protein [Sanguibacter gelidistatuariae]|uniref:ABC-2 type transport system permease protein n=1 Tax=Sanguibacter gelidistatuariae TaxID=1814289 RepID=A0A1G6LC96_9MICO|nr:hypothetical protein [Sanguibacter gelidistatuariae]SDC40890.1 ABC-2 type transport system permease protein [Sanguibacter gelidistatuariae]